MKPNKKFNDIIERIEYLRNLLNLNKSRFSADIGMKPQTYNNFIGSQGSKPNVELITGIVNRFGVNPIWLLNGRGPIFLEEEKSEEYLSKSPAVLVRGFAGATAVQEEGSAFATTKSEVMEAINQEIIHLQPLLEEFESQIKLFETSQFPLLDRYISLLRRYYDLDPVAVIQEMREMVGRMSKRIGSPKGKK